MKKVYRYIYDHGGKGVTVYRDGTRSKQVLTTRAKNAEFADESEAAEAIVEQIGEVFGGVEAFLDNEDVQQAIDAEISDLLESHRAASDRLQRAQPAPRLPERRHPAGRDGLRQAVRHHQRGRERAAVRAVREHRSLRRLHQLFHGGARESHLDGAPLGRRSRGDRRRATGYPEPESRVGQRRADPVDPGRDRHRASALPRRRCR